MLFLAGEIANLKNLVQTWFKPIGIGKNRYVFYSKGEFPRLRKEFGKTK